VDGVGYGWIWDLFIHPLYRCRGYGKEALRQGETEGRRALGINEIRLNAFVSNEPAIRLYERFECSATSQVVPKPLE
jgi:ribosomal protein S18 acetylase RimI-like enzyme